MASPIFIVGAGAVGLHLAARLSAVAPVTLVARSGRAASLARDGFEISGLDPATYKHIPTRDLRGPFPPDADILVAVKSAQLAGILPELRLRPGQPIGLCHNGLGISALARSLVPHIVPVLVAGWTGALLSAPLVVRVTHLSSLELAADAPAVHSTRDRLARLFAGLGFPARVAPSVAAAEWRAALWHLAVAAPCAALGEKNGAVLDSPPLQAVARAVLDEARAVAAAEGVTLDDADIEQVFQMTRSVRDVRGGLLHDLARGVATDMPFLNAEVARRAAARGQPALVNAVVARMVEHLERRPRDADGKLA
jgi:2-dehydropantoate 2-reductase